MNSYFLKHCINANILNTQRAGSLVNIQHATKPQQHLNVKVTDEGLTQNNRLGLKSPFPCTIT